MADYNRLTILTEYTTANSSYPKGGVSCSKDSFVVHETLVFQIKFCGKSPALRVAAKRYLAFEKTDTNDKTTNILNYHFDNLFGKLRTEKN